MKKTIKLAVVAALALGATSAFATNGSALIGMGAKSRGMAGTSIGIGHGAESALSNPALITTIKADHEISFGGTLFMPNVKADTGAGAKSSDADMNVIPEVSLASKVNDNFYWGVGMWGTAGMGVDYRNEASLYKMVTNLQLMQFGVPLAYTTNGFTVAVAPVLQYGALDINFNNGSVRGAGIAQDLGFGFNVGASYEVSNLTIGAVYKSRIDMDYKNQLPDAGIQFGLTLGKELSTPAELGIGASYVMGEHTVALDYKQIKWSDAKGYKDFKWDDQNVVSVGYEYNAKNWAARIGYNYASNPIVAQDGTTPTGGAINTLNLLGFPAVVESHYAVGGTYNFSEATSIDLAYTYAAEKTETFDNSGIGGAGVTTKHSQSGVSAQLNFNF